MDDEPYEIDAVPFEEEPDIEPDELSPSEEELESDDDIDTDTLITADNINRIPDTERKTANILTKYERTRLISTRVVLLENGSAPLVDTTNLTSNLEIAEKELNERKIPLTVIRNVGNKKYEEYTIDELIF